MIMPPVLGSSYEINANEWSIIPDNRLARSVFPPQNADLAAAGLSIQGIPAWGAVGQGLSSETDTITWFIGGTNNSWAGTPIAIAIVYESDLPQKAMADGSWILKQLTAISGGE
jgi:hypothetical protein